MNTVQIDSVLVHELVVPAHPGLTDSPNLSQTMDGVPWDRWPICLIEFCMSDGITALGEVKCGVPLSDIAPFLKRLPGMKVFGPGLGGLPASFRSEPLWGLMASHDPAL